MSKFETCPCCDYPTLTERGMYEICPICWWEDQSELVTGIAGGPSLKDARANFASHFDCFTPGKRNGAVANPSPGRQSLLAYLAAVQQGDRAHDVRVLYGLLRDMQSEGP